MQHRFRHSPPIGPRQWHNKRGGFSADWSKSGIITVDNTGGAEQTDYQIELNLISDNFDFTSANINGSDLRFVDNGTVLSYFIQSFDAELETGKIWIKIPLILANTIKQITVYYGNAEAEAQSSGVNTFDHYEDFTEKLGIKDYFIDAALSGFHSRNQEPAQYFNGKTYIGFNGPRDDPYAIVYDHNTETYSSPVKIGTNPKKIDEHGQPALLVDDLGYIHVFYGTHNSALKYAKSTNSEDISAWTAKSDPIADDATYPQVIQKADGTIYLFARIDSPTRQWGYITSVDGGTNWSGFNAVIDQKCNATVTLGDDGKIHVGFANTQGAARYQRYDIYYMYLDSDGDWKDITDNVLSLPYTIAAGTQVFDSDKNTIEPQIKVIDGKPYLFFIELDENDESYFLYKFASYSDGWNVISITLGDMSMGYVLLATSSSEFHVYLLRNGNLEKWITLNGGTTWSLSETILEDGDFVAREVYNGQSEAFLLIENIVEDWTNIFSTNKIYLYGSSGFVQRNFVTDPASDRGSSDFNSFWNYLFDGTKLLATHTSKKFYSGHLSENALPSDNYIIEADCEMSASAALGIYSNVQSDHQAYAAIIWATNNYFWIYKVDIDANYADMFTSSVATDTITPSLNTRYSLKLTRIGNDFTFTCNGNTLLGTDSSFSGGKCGVLYGTNNSNASTGTGKFYFIRARKSSTVIPVITLT